MLRDKEEGMSGSKVKKIRREVYGDMADQRKYGKHIKTGQVLCSGLRSKYQAVKKER